MSSAKDIVVRPISRKDADALVRRVHYSGKVVSNAQLHVGVFLNGVLEGAMQFGPSMCKEKLIGLVSGTKWNGFLELNRMAFSDVLPRNSESRALGIVLRQLRKSSPNLEWIVSFADGAQCGDGTIYRAAGFVLTGISPSKMYRTPEGEAVHRISFTSSDGHPRYSEAIEAKKKAVHYLSISARGTRANKEALELQRANPERVSLVKAYCDAHGLVPIPGAMLRYLFFLNPAALDRLTVPVIPFDEIRRRGLSMVRGVSLESAENGTPETIRRGRCDSDLQAPTSSFPSSIVGEEEEVESQGEGGAACG